MDAFASSLPLGHPFREGVFRGTAVSQLIPFIQKDDLVNPKVRALYARFIEQYPELLKENGIRVPVHGPTEYKRRPRTEKESWVSKVAFEAVGGTLPLDGDRNAYSLIEEAPALVRAVFAFARGDVDVVTLNNVEELLEIAENYRLPLLKTRCFEVIFQVIWNSFANGDVKKLRNFYQKLKGEFWPEVRIACLALYGMRFEKVRGSLDTDYRKYEELLSHLEVDFGTGQINILNSSSELVEELKKQHLYSTSFSTI